MTPAEAAFEARRRQAEAEAEAAAAAEAVPTRLESLVAACANGDVAQAKTLLRHTDCNALPLRTNWPQTPLGAAVGAGSSACVKLLLRAQADPDIECDPLGSTALSCACSSVVKNASVIAQLLKAGADADRVSNRGGYQCTPLTFACIPSSSGQQEVKEEQEAAVRALVREGADLLATNADGSTALQYLLRNGPRGGSSRTWDSVRLLCALGGRQPGDEEVLADDEDPLARSLDRFMRATADYTPLMHLAGLHDTRLVRALLVEDGFPLPSPFRALPSLPPHIPHPYQTLDTSSTGLDQIRFGSHGVYPQHEDGEFGKELASSFETRRLLSWHYVMRAWRDTFRARRIVVWWLKVSSERACAPDGPARKRDREEFEAAFGAAAGIGS